MCIRDRLDVGVPLIVIVFDAHAAVTPGGNPVGVPMPVAPVVVLVIGVNAVLIPVSYTHLDVYKRQCQWYGVIKCTRC